MALLEWRRSHGCAAVRDSASRTCHQLDGTAIVRVRAGRIEEIWDNVDLLAIYTQLGMISTPGSVADQSGTVV